MPKTRASTPSTALQTGINKHDAVNARREAARKAWETRRRNAEARRNPELELDTETGIERELGSDLLQDCDEYTPAATILFRVDDAIDLGWRFIFSRSAEGKIQGAASLPLCNGDHVVTELVSVDGGPAAVSQTKRIFEALLDQIEEYESDND